MKRVGLLFACVLTLVCCSACAPEDRSMSAPSNWPRYTFQGLSIAQEAGWTDTDVSPFASLAAESFEALDVKNTASWVACMQSPQSADGERNYLAITSYAAGAEVTDEALKRRAEELQALRASYVDAGLSTIVLSSPTVAKFGSTKAMYYACRFTLADESKVVLQSALVGHGDQLYQFTYLDYADTSDENQLRRILTSLTWNP